MAATPGAIVTPVAMAPMTVPPVPAIPAMMLAPAAMTDVTTAAIAVAPPAAIANVLNGADPIRLQREKTGRKLRGARARSEAPKCERHRATERDQRKQFSHTKYPF